MYSTLSIHAIFFRLGRTTNSILTFTCSILTESNVSVEFGGFQLYDLDVSY